MEELQSGVRKDEPAAPTRRWKHIIKAFEDEKAEELDEQSDDGYINVLSEDVAYAQEHVALNHTDWINPDTETYVVEMPLCQLMELRQVKLDGEPPMTIRPWANNLNNGRC
eukprot:8453286-Heterocapsa_arctica.AAC.1